MPSDSPCCQNEYAHLQVLKEFQVVNSAVSLEAPPLMVVPGAHTSITQVEQERLPTPRYRHYRPPLLQRDIPVMLATFLI